MEVRLRAEAAGEDVALFALAGADGSDVVGSAVLCRQPVTRLARAAYPDTPELGYLQVRAGARGNGVGTALIAFAEHLARERDEPAMTLGVGLDNPRARALYRRHGYRGTGVVDSYEYAGIAPDGTTRVLRETAETLRKVLCPQPAATPDVVAAVARLAATRAGQVRWVGIDGWGAAGKSTLAAAIAAAVPDAVVVHVDDFASPSVPEWDWTRFNAQLVAPLLDGRAARYQRWNWETDSGADWHPVEPGAVVVVEGVSATRREVRVPWALTVWVDAPREERLRRAVERDGEAMLPRWLDDWLPSEEAYVARENPAGRVDLVVRGTSEPESGHDVPQSGRGPSSGRIDRS